MFIKRAFYKIINFLQLHKKLIILLVIFAAHVFFRFYQLSERMHFDWDHVDNAWHAMNIIVNHKFPLVGMVAKLDSGFNIGPLYYYLIAIIYWIFNLHPIASPVMAGLTSIFSFFVIFYVIKKLFTYNIALIALGIHTVSYFIITMDRSQWPVNFITPVSFLVFYSLYNVLTGKVKYLLVLALTIGFSFHIHFTSVFYPIIVLLSLPFFPKNKQTIKYILLAIPIFLIFLVPNIIAEILSKNTHINNMASYIHSYFHGLYLTRIFQLTNDVFVEFQLIMRGWFHNMNYLLVFVFFIIYYLLKPTIKKFIMSYLIGLWFIVPWLVFSTYGGEISNYYFFSTRPIVILILAFLTYKIFIINNYLPKLAIVVFWIYFSYVNIAQFFLPEKGNLEEATKNAKSAIQKGEFIDAYPYTPESYLYYYYTHINKDKK